MAATFPIDSICHPLLTPGAHAYSETCVAVEDRNGDRRSDVIITRYTGEDGHHYELQAQANSPTHQWGPGSEVTLTDRNFGQPQVLARYRITATYTPEPLDIGTEETNECLPSPTARRPDANSADFIPMPNGQRAFVVMRDNAKGQDIYFNPVLVPWVKLGLMSSADRVTLQIKSEDAGDQYVFAIERGEGLIRREARFKPPRGA